MHRTLFSTLTAFAALGLAAAPAARAQISYTITDVGLLPDGTYSFGNGVNNSGQVTGRATTTDGLEHAFLYTPGVGITDIGTLPGGLYSSGAAINDAGQVTGYSYTSSAGIHPFLYSGSAGMADLGTFGFGDVGEGDFGYGINSSGQVTGQVCVANNTIHAFLYTTATDFQDLGTLGGTNSISYGINDAGQVTGYAETPANASHAFLYSKGTGITDLGTLPGGTYSIGYGINFHAQVTGTSGAANGESYAFLYSSGVMKNLGTLPLARDSDGYGVNSSGTVVGDATLSNIYDRAVVYTQRTGMQDLNDLIPANSGWQLESAASISDTGYITGYGLYNGGYRAFLLTPVAAVYPVLLHLDPASRTEGRDGFTLTVLGTNFTAQSAIRWNGAAQPTTYVSSTTLTAPIPAALIAQAGTAEIRVFTPGAGVSHSRTETIHPRPVVSVLYPSHKKAGSAAFTLTVTGTGFRPASEYAPSVVKWNGAALATIYVSSMKLTAQVPASLLTKSGTATVTVTTPEVATSAGKAFTITP